MKLLLAQLATVAALALLFLAFIGLATVTDTSSMVARHRLNSVQADLDHERTMNWLLARRVGEQEKGKQ